MTDKVRDLFENDPFFKVIPDPEWNAAVGRQGHEENYLDGFIEAAIELTDAIIEKKLYEKRDTLVLPILYNARHALELSLKFSTQKLIAAGQIKDDQRELSHDLAAYWNHLDKSAVGDQKLSATFAALKAYVDSLTQVDSDGQELRYHKNREGDLSLAKFAIINLRLMRISLRALQKLLSDLKYRTLSYVDECTTGTFTSRCSRTDLLVIATQLPPRADWDKPVFDERKAEIKAAFGLGSKHFTEALNKLQACREMQGMLGVETPLLHLSDEDITWVIAQWRNVHIKRDPSAPNEDLDYFDPDRFAKMKDYIDTVRETVAVIDKKLTPQKLADLEVLFYLGRERHYCEEYEPMVDSKLKEHAAARNSAEEVRHLVEKTSLLQCVRESARKLGRLHLADELENA